MREGDNFPELRDALPRADRQARPWRRPTERLELVARAGRGARARRRRAGGGPARADHQLPGARDALRPPAAGRDEERFLDAWTDSTVSLLEVNGLVPEAPTKEARMSYGDHITAQPGSDPLPAARARHSPGADRLLGAARAAVVLRRLPRRHRRLGPRPRPVRRAPRDRRRRAVRGARRPARLRRRQPAAGTVLAAADRLADLLGPPLPLARVQPRALRHGRRGRQHRHARLDGDRRRAGALLTRRRETVPKAAARRRRRADRRRQRRPGGLLARIGVLLLAARVRHGRRADRACSPTTRRHAAATARSSTRRPRPTASRTASRCSPRPRRPRWPAASSAWTSAR